MALEESLIKRLLAIPSVAVDLDGPTRFEVQVCELQSMFPT